jgi:hypothetical protein
MKADRDRVNELHRCETSYIGMKTIYIKFHY